MTRQEIEAKIREGFDAWNRHDAAGTVATMAPDAVLMDNANRIEGRDAMQAMAEQYFSAFPDFHLELVRLYVDGNTAVQEWRATGTHEGDLMGIPATHRRTETLGLGLDEFGDDGVVHRSMICWDTAKLLQDIGVMPAQEAATA